MDQHSKVAQKCTLCYDRLQGGLEPACAKACPTQSIQFGPVIELREKAQQRVEALHSQGVPQAQLYGADEAVYGGLNAFFLLMDEPETYHLPNAANAVLPSRNNARGYLTTLVTGALAVLGGLIALRRRRERPADPEPAPAPDPVPASPEPARASVD
jgi:formate dehydrogenase iron-sulfur subunit